jgi:O-antigen/teichoic acid export membrane protein
LAASRVIFDCIRALSSIWLVYAGFGVTGVLLGWFASEFIAVVLYGYSALKGIPRRENGLSMKPIIVFALPSLVFQAIDVTIQNTDRVILFIHTNLTTLAVYDVMLSLLFMMSFVSLTVSGALYPVMTRVRLSSDEDTQTSDHLAWALSQSVRYILILLLPVAMIVSLNSYMVLDLLFGPSYSNSPDAPISLSILVLIYVLWGVTYLLHSVLRSIGEKKFFLVTGICVVVFELVLAWILTSFFGLLGATIVRTLYVTLLFLLALGRMKQKDVTIDFESLSSIPRIVFSSIVSGLVVLLAAPLDLAWLGIWLIVSMLVYFLLLVITRATIRLDFRLAKSVLPSSIHRIIDRIERMVLR